MMGLHAYYMVTLFDPINYASQKRPSIHIIEGIIEDAFFSTIICQVAEKSLPLRFIRRKSFELILEKQFRLYNGTVSVTYQV